MMFVLKLNLYMHMCQQDPTLSLSETNSQYTKYLSLLPITIKLSEENLGEVCMILAWTKAPCKKEPEA